VVPEGTDPVLSMCSPLWVGTLKLHAQAYEGFRTIASEWQRFVAGRLYQDFVLMQRVAQSRTPDQVWTAHAEFWQRAVEDYGREYMIMGKLVADLTARERGSGVFRSSRIG
jgi:hypothetical protein